MLADISLEVARAAILLVLVVVVFRRGRNESFHVTSGWRFIQFGFLLLFLGAVLDITDNFDSLSSYVVIGDTKAQAFLEQVVGYLGGFVLLAVGLIKWEPSSQKLSAEISERAVAEERFQKVFQSSPGLTTIGTLEDGCLIDANDAWLSTLGYTRDEVIGKTVIELGIWEDPDRRIQFVKSVRENGGRVHDFETSVLTKSGKRRYISISTEMIDDSGTKLLIVASQDVTDRVEVERNLRQSEDRLAAVLDGGQQGYWDWNIETGEVLRNDRWAQMLGYDSIEEFENNVDTWTNSIHPDDRSSAWTSIQDHLEGRSDSHKAEYRMFAKDGSIKWIRDQARIIKRDDSGRAIRMSGTHTDITDLKETEKELIKRTHNLNEATKSLRESQARFRDFIDAASDWYWEMGADLRFTYFSDRFTEATGIDRDEYIGRTTAELGQPDVTAELWNEHLDRLAAHENFRDFTYSIQRPNGLRLHFRTSGVAVFDDNGVFSGYRGTGTNITAEVEAEGKAQRVQERLFQAVEAMQDGFVLFDSEDKLIVCNQKYREIYREIADILNPGITFREIVQAAVECNQISRASEDPEVWIQTRLRQHQNPTGPFDQKLTRGAWLRILEQKLDDGSTIGLRIDITKAKEEEEKLRKLSHALEQSPSMVFITDTEGTIEYVNPMFTRLTGYSAEEVIGQNPRILKSSETPPEVYAELWHAITSGHDWRGDITDRKKDGSLFTAYAMISPVKGEDGKISHFVSMHEDVTERKALESQLRQSQKMEAVGHLTGGIAHDFNNLMGVMMGNAELLKDWIGDDTRSLSKIDAIIEAVKRGSALTHRLLAFSRQQALLSEAIKADSLIKGIEDMLQRSLGETIELRTDLTCDYSTVLVDKHQFENALLNLAINARDAMPNGGTLTIKLAEATLDKSNAGQHDEVKPGDYLEVSVTDTGTGMSPEVKEKIFEPFFTTKEVGKGSGLGLPMVFGFMKQTGGHIAVDSELGRGTTFRLYLPYAEKVTSKEDRVDQEERSLSGTEHILLVEDDEFLRDIAVQLLEAQGYQITQASNGKEATQHLMGDEPIDLLFTDMVLPGGMTGAQIAKEAERVRPSIKVLYATGYSEDAIRLNGGKLNPGVNFVKKPYVRNELLRMIRELLDSSAD